MTKTDARPTNVQGRHHRTRGVRTSGRRRGKEEEISRAVTGIYPGCPLDTDVHMRRADGVLQRRGAEQCRFGSSPECPLGTDAHMRRVGGVFSTTGTGEESAHAVTGL